MVHRGLRNVKIEGPYSTPRQAFEGHNYKHGEDVEPLS